VQLLGIFNERHRAGDALIAAAGVDDDRQLTAAAASGAGTPAERSSGMKIVPTAAEVPAADGIALFTMVVASDTPMMTNGPAFFSSFRKTAIKWV